MHKLLPLLSLTILAASGSAKALGKGFDDMMSFDFGGFGSLKPITSFFISDLDSYIVSASAHHPIESEEESIELDYFECPVYGPFHLGDENFEATFKYRADIVNQDIIERIRIIDSNNTVVSATSHKSFSYVDNELIETSFIIPIRDYLTNNGLTIKFEIVNRSTREVLKCYSATIYPLTTPSLTASYLKSNAYETNPIAFYGDGEGMQEITELFDFTYISDYLDADYYYRLNLKNISCYYTSKLALSYSDITLRFNDDDNLFPYCTHDANNNVNIPLKATISYGKATLDYLYSFYTNKRTLQSGNIYQSGFVSTKDFYLPINGRRKFNNKAIYLDFHEFGQSKITVSFPVRYIADRTLVGVCSDGGYCVSGGSK